jgi:sugar lactone lactonase YvrE
MSIRRTLPDSLTAVGAGLSRPECVLATASGDVATSDWRGGVSVVRSGGQVERRLAVAAPIAVRPNGIALTERGEYLLAHLGDTGGVWTLGANGALSAALLEVDGAPLPPTNFAVRDESRRTWVSVSTRHYPRQLAWRGDVADGFVICVDDRGARVVADGLHYANEVRLDPAGRFLYVVETFGRRVSRLPVAADGTLGPRETVLQLGYGFLPDGLAFDVEGGVWVTSLVSNRVVRLRADGVVETIVEECNDDFVDVVEAAIASGTMAAGHLGRIPGTQLQHVTSLSFGGIDRQTVFLGSLHGECVHRFHSPVPGVPAPFSDGPL